MDNQSVAVANAPNREPVVELMRTGSLDSTAPTGTYEWLRARRRARKTIPITTEELLRQLDERDPA